MAILLGRTTEKIGGELLHDVATQTGLTQSSPGAKVRSLTDAVSKAVGYFFKRMDMDLINSFLSGATEQYLDFIGEMLGMPRLGRENVSVSATHKNLKFYVLNNTFGSINGGVSFILPSGTYIYTRSGGTGGVRYKTVYSTLLRSTDSYQYIAAEAIQAGAKANTGANTLIYHDFINYSDAANGTLLVTNESEIFSGQEPESDKNYKYRLSNAVMAAQGANPIAIRLAILTVPGVADLVMDRYYRGIGTFDVIIKSTTPNCPDSLLAAINSAVLDTVAEGIFFTIKKPIEVGVSLKATLKLDKAMSETEKNSLIGKVQQVVTDYINNLDIGEELVINEIVERIMSSDTNIKDIGTPQKPLDSLYVYKPTKLEDNKIRYTLTQNYVPRTDERLIVETENTTDTPIDIGIAL